MCPLALKNRPSLPWKVVTTRSTTTYVRIVDHSVQGQRVTRIILLLAIILVKKESILRVGVTIRLVNFVFCLFFCGKKSIFWTCSTKQSVLDPTTFPNGGALPRTSFTSKALRYQGLCGRGEKTFLTRGCRLVHYPMKK